MTKHNWCLNEDCDYCKLTNAQLREALDDAKAVRLGLDITKKNHLVEVAKHHVGMQHGLLGMKTVDFFKDHEATVPYVIMAQSLALALMTDAIHMMMRLEVIPPIGIAPNELRNLALNNLIMSSLFSTLYTIYLTTKGEYCLWGLIDPAMCKEAQDVS